MFGRASLLARNLVKSNVRFSSKGGANAHYRSLGGGIPGENLPIHIRNRYILSAYFIVFVGSGLGAPFFVVRYQYSKR